MRARLLFIPILFLSYSAAHAQAGTLDASFSGDGKLVWEQSPSFDVASGVVVQSDGKIVATGRIDSAGVDLLLVCRMMPDGTPDLSFGTGGVSGTFLGIYETCQGYDVNLQSTGAIVVSGIAVNGGPANVDVVLARFLPDGTLDGSFGNAGVVITDVGNGPGAQSPLSMRIMNDDRIVVVGAGNDVPFVARFTADGDPDNSYGTNGVAWCPLASAGFVPMAMRSDGSVVAGGYAVSGTKSLVAAFDANGLPNATFSNDGIDTLDISPVNEAIYGLDLLPDGRVAVCGYDYLVGQPVQPFIALLGATGGLDASFGTNGAVHMNYPGVASAEASQLIVSPDDKILVAGHLVYTDPSEANDFFLYRMLQDGTFDPAFAGGGQVLTDVSTHYDAVQHMALAPNGSIVLSGYAADGLQTGGAYARYINDIGTGVTSPTSADHRLTAFPNPATDRVTLEFVLREAGPVMIALFDADGRSVLSVDAGERSPGKQQCTIALRDDLANGSYTARITTAEGVLTTAVVVARVRR